MGPNILWAKRPTKCLSFSDDWCPNLIAYPESQFEWIKECGKRCQCEDWPLPLLVILCHSSCYVTLLTGTPNHCNPIHSFAPVDAMASRAIIISCQWHIRIVGVPAGGERRSAQKTAGCSRGDLAWLAGFLGIIG